MTACRAVAMSMRDVCGTELKISLGSRYWETLRIIIVGTQHSAAQRGASRITSMYEWFSAFNFELMGLRCVSKKKFEAFERYMERSERVDVGSNQSDHRKWVPRSECVKNRDTVVHTDETESSDEILSPEVQKYPELCNPELRT